MAVWMDLTYTMSLWKGGVVGIVRAELELAKNLHKINKEIRFCKATAAGFVEIDTDSLSWLWNSEKTGDAYLKEMNRYKSAEKKEPEMPQGLKSAYGYSLGRYDRIKRLGYMLIKNTPWAIRFIPYILFSPIWLISKIISVIKKNIKKINFKNISDRYSKIESARKQKIVYPFKNEDVFFTAGWPAVSGIIKEEYLSYIKDELPALTVSYLIYDVIFVNPDTAALYDFKEAFKKYLLWIGANCDYIFYGGNTAKKDTEKFFKENGFPIKKGYVLKFGSDVAKGGNAEEFDIIRKKYKLEKNYILAVGSVDTKKNYITLYYAYKHMTLLTSSDKIPQLVIIGGKFGNTNFTEFAETDPDIKEKIVFLRPSDDELAQLYRNCRFSVLPTWYEGWSLTLPESLEFGKFCLASDVAPLREIGGDLIDYADPNDPKEWAEKILFYLENKTELEKLNKNIKEKYKPIRWYDCAEVLNNNLIDINKYKIYKDSRWNYDLSLAYALCLHDAPVSGILRTQLLLARYLGRLYPHMKFIAFNEREVVYLDRFTYLPLLMDEPIDVAFGKMKYSLRNDFSNKTNNINNAEKFSDKEIIWMFISLFPSKFRDKLTAYVIRKKLNKLSAEDNTRLLYKIPLKEDEIVFSTGAGYSADLYATISAEKNKNKFKFIQLIYDLTPIVCPQVHTLETRTFYKPFLKNVYKISDYIFFGGKTAMLDSMEYAKKNGFEDKESFPIKFGSDISTKNIKLNDSTKLKLFEKIGIDKDYILTVGSIEARKNHEILYRAYVKMLRENKDVPQLVFCGYPGWKTEWLLGIISRDDRVKDKLIIYSPSDEELDILYKNCLFTVLASIYEGWSLTLPESLNYGKFCLCTDTPPLKEIGADLLDYVKPYDVAGWAEKMMYYANNHDELTLRQEQIKSEWKPVSWKECAENVGKIMEGLTVI